MGSHPRSLSSSGLRLLLRLLSVVAALCVLSVSGRAAAATGQLPSDAAVPMCGEHNDSVEAPPIFRGAADDVLRALPCHAPDQLGVSQNAPSAPKPLIVFERPERVLAFGALGIADSASSRISIASASRALERPGFVGVPFRPPRA